MRKSILLKAVSWNYDTNDQAKESAQTVSNLAGLLSLGKAGEERTKEALPSIENVVTVASPADKKE